MKEVLRLWVKQWCFKQTKTILMLYDPGMKLMTLLLKGLKQEKHDLRKQQFTSVA